MYAKCDGFNDIPDELSECSGIIWSFSLFTAQMYTIYKEEWKQKRFQVSFCSVVCLPSAGKKSIYDSSEGWKKPQQLSRLLYSSFDWNKNFPLFIRCKSIINCLHWWGGSLVSRGPIIPFFNEKKSKHWLPWNYSKLFKWMQNSMNTNCTCATPNFPFRTFLYKRKWKCW